MLDLNTIIKKFESSKLNVYIRTEFLQGTQFTSPLIKNDNVAFDEVISLNDYKIFLESYQQKNSG